MKEPLRRDPPLSHHSIKESLVKLKHFFYLPYIRTEINRHMPRQEREAYLAYLRGMGYRVVPANENDGPGTDDLEESALSNPRTFDIWALPKEA